MSESRICEGGYLCGAVRYRATPQPLSVGHCHCRMCRRHTGSVFATGAEFSADAFAWTQGQPVLYRSSQKAQRGFGARGGSTLSFHRPEKGEIDIFVGTLDHPEEVTPEYQIFTESGISWAQLDCGLTSHSRYPSQKQDRDLGL